MIKKTFNNQLKLSGSCCAKYFGEARKNPGVVHN